MAEIDVCADAIVRPDAAADTSARFEHADDEAGIVQQTRRDEARHAGADDDDALALARAHRPGAGHAHDPDHASIGNDDIASKVRPPAACNAAASLYVAPT